MSQEAKIGCAIAGTILLILAAVTSQPFHHAAGWVHDRLTGVHAELTQQTAETEAGPATTASAPAATRQRVRSLVGQVDVVDARPSEPGYDRDCGTGHGCVFGPAWTDDTDMAYGHNGCGTRDDVLRRDLRDLVLKPDTNGCVVLGGLLADPYTGRRIDFDKATAYEVAVDHVVPLARAWDLGASSWPLARRVEFANDPRNLLAVDGPANSTKSDQGPGEWLPINGSFRCAYVAQFLSVSIAYDLPVTAADHKAARLIARTCPQDAPRSHAQGDRRRDGGVR